MVERFVTVCGPRLSAGGTSAPNSISGCPSCERTRPTAVHAEPSYSRPNRGSGHRPCSDNCGMPRLGVLVRPTSQRSGATDDRARCGRWQPSRPSTDSRPYRSRHRHSSQPTSRPPGRRCRRSGRETPVERLRLVASHQPAPPELRSQPRKGRRQPRDQKRSAPEGQMRLPGTEPTES